MAYRDNDLLAVGMGAMVKARYLADKLQEAQSVYALADVSATARSIYEDRMKAAVDQAKGLTGALGELVKIAADRADYAERAPVQ